MKHSNHIKVKVGNHTFAIKNLEVYERMSEETTAFCADLYVGDKFIGICENSGKGEGNYPRITSTKDWDKNREEFKNDLEINRCLYDNVANGVAKHHYFNMAGGYTCDWDYDMDFLIADMVYTAWYFGKTTYQFADEK